MPSSQLQASNSELPAPNSNPVRIKGSFSVYLPRYGWARCHLAKPMRCNYLQPRMFSQRFWAGSALLAAFALCGSGCDKGGGAAAGNTTDAPAYVFDLGSDGDTKIGLVAALNGDLKPW